MIRTNWYNMTRGDKTFALFTLLTIDIAIASLYFYVTKDFSISSLILTLLPVVLVPFGIATFPTKANDYGRGIY